ncbi:MAG: tyrosine-protein phosphatase [Faecousia sp.]
MIDLHSHILPQLDDGSQSLEESLAMARLAVQSGVTAIVATPHCMDDRAASVSSSFRLLREALQETEIPLKLYLGMEIFGTPYTCRFLQDRKLFTLNGSQYPLIEFSFRSTGEEETEILEDLVRVGYRPLIAHPERYPYVWEDPELINLWTQMGCLLQINRGSLFGRFGSGPQRMAIELVDRGFAAVISTDSHSPRVRTPWMKDIQALLSQEYSPELAQDLLLRNPQHILKNEPVPPMEPEWF